MKLNFCLVVSIFLIESCTTPNKPARIFRNIEHSLQTQLIAAHDGDTINLPEGNFMFTKSLIMDGKSNIVIRGKGMDKTVLSWKNQVEGAQGILVTNGKNVVLEDFAVEDARGDNLKVSDTRGITLRRIRSEWTEGPKPENGAYALYPVLSTRVLMEECLAIGSSDAGIYVGQSDSVVIRNNKAYWNVAGIESENSKWVEIYGNEAYDNTGGILVFDLPGLTRYGHSTKVYKNNVHDNNHENFAHKGNIVASIPPGSGMMILATHTTDIYDNDIIDNRSVGTAIISYELVAAINAGEDTSEGAPGGAQTVNNNYKSDSLYNAFPYDIHLHDNRFSNNHWIPSLNSDIGKLLLTKSFLNPPDVLYDGVQDPNRPDRRICIQESDELTFINLDAGNDFKGFSRDVTSFRCRQ